MELRLWIRSMRVALAGLASLVVVYALLRFGGVLGEDLGSIQMAIAIMATLWGILLVAGDAVLPREGIDWIMLLALLYGIFRVAIAGYPYAAQQEFAYFAMLAAFFFAVRCILDSIKAQHIAISVLIFLATAEALYGVTQYFLKSDHILGAVQPLIYHGRASGTFINPNHGAFWMGVGIALSVPLALLGRGVIAGKIFSGYAAVACGLGLMVTYSRGGWLGVAVALFCLAGWMIWKERPLWLGWSLLLVLVIGIAAVADRAFTTIRAQGRFQIRDVRFTAIWPAAYHIWLNHPVVGAGPGQFVDQFRRYRPGQHNMQSEPQHTHNDYLNILADWGSVGGLLMLSVLGVVAFALCKHVGEAVSATNSRRSGRRAWLVALTAAWLYVAVHEGSDFHLYVPANGLLLAILCALAAAVERPRDGARGSMGGGHWGLRILVGTAVVTGAFFLAVEGRATRNEAGYLRAVDSGRLPAAEALTHLLHAWEVRPDNPATNYKIGELYRQTSTEGAEESPVDAQLALIWLQRAVKLNPRQPYYWISLGRLQHWFGQSTAARESFRNALDLDPQNYRVQAFYGWYLYESGDLAGALRWLKRSAWLQYEQNTIAKYYVPKIERTLRAEGKWPPSGLADLKNRNPDE